MYNLNSIRVVHLEVTSNCQARCPMCPRRIQGGPINPYIKIEDITLEKFKSWFDIDFLKQLNKLFMCGNLGDPIIAKDTLEIFEYIRSINENIDLSMHTNGSARDVNWWESLAELNVSVIFGIDGLEDTHSLYRISTDWNKIIENSRAFIAAGGNASWHMLVFKHNEHQVDKCKRLSEIYGFKKFTTKHTSRFKDDYLQVLDDDNNVLYQLEPTEKSLEIKNSLTSSMISEGNTIFCKAKKHQEIYVAASGNVSPCCWLDLEWMSDTNLNKIDYENKIGYFANLNHITLKEIFDSDFFNKIESTWHKDPLRECSKQCSIVDKLNIQFG